MTKFQAKMPKLCTTIHRCSKAGSVSYNRQLATENSLSHSWVASMAQYMWKC